MAITITAYDANKDGKGIDFAAYLKAYDKTYVPSSRGSFSSAPVGSTFDAAQYASYNGSKYGVVLSAVKGKNFKYSWEDPEHKLYGSIADVVFGNKITADFKADRFKVTSDLKISGLNITNQSVVDTMVGDLMNGKNTAGGATTGLLNVLKANAINFVGSTGKDTFTGFGKADNISGGNGNDVLYGGAGNDKIRGGNHNDRLYGDSGDDRLYGDAGNDRLYGGSGNDKLYGGSGNDILYGGTGNDILSGGSGADTFIIKKGQGSDRIVDFEAGRKGADKIQLDKTVLKNFADVLAHATETRSGDLIIKYGADTITLDNVAKIGLHSGDFLFV